MFTKFKLLVGSGGDLHELEYISALHQTDINGLRKDASIKAEDIRVFLKSRYGIEVSKKEVCDKILTGYVSGRYCQDDDDVIDLMELVAVLLIPTLSKAAENLKVSKQSLNKSKPLEARDIEDIQKADERIPVSAKLLETVCSMILEDVTGDQEPKLLSTELVKNILVAYGEYRLAADDELVQEMIDAIAPTTQQEDAEDNTKSTNSEEQTARVSSVTDEVPVLNVDTFAELLTRDIWLYDTEMEVEQASHFEVIFSTQKHKKSPAGSRKSKPEFDSDMYETWIRKGTVPAIDITAATYRSKALTVTLWATIVMTYFAYFNTFDADLKDTCGTDFVYSDTDPWKENKRTIACHILRSIVDWLYSFGAISLFGIFSALLGNSGNSIYANQLWKHTVGMFSVLLLVLIPFIWFRDDDGGDAVLRTVSLLLGLVTCSFHLRHVVELCTLKLDTAAKSSSSKKPRPTTAWPSLTSTEQQSRQAAARKLSMMVANALAVGSAIPPDSSRSTHYMRMLQNFTSTAHKQLQEVGGFTWSWQRILSMDQTFLRDGIWIPERMIGSNIAHYMIGIYNYDSEEVFNAFVWFARRTLGMATPDVDAFSNLAINVSSIVAQVLPAIEAIVPALGCTDSSLSVEDIVSSFCTPSGDGNLFCDPNAQVNYLCPLVDPNETENLSAAAQQAFLVGAGVDQELLVNTAQSATEQTFQTFIEEAFFDSLYPSEKYMVMAPLVCGTLLAISLTFFLAITYLPSVVTTMLRLRSGHIPTLTDENFAYYRRNQEHIAYLTGSMFWGAVFTSVLVGAMLFWFLFFFLWQGTVFFAQRVVAVAIGILFVTVVRKGLVWLVIKYISPYKAFYRERPAATNISILALEWANFTVAVGFIFVRIFFFLAAGAMYLGRLDTYFLAKDIRRVGPYINFDDFPSFHLKEILSHEAHRHPYIEQLGLLYMMRLRYGAYFASRAGSAWRLIFVHALMPWLQKYRFATRKHQIGTVDIGNDRGEEIDPGRQSFHRTYPSLASAHTITFSDVGSSSFFGGNSRVNDEGSSSFSFPGHQSSSFRIFAPLVMPETSNDMQKRGNYLDPISEGARKDESRGSECFASSSSGAKVWKLQNENMALKQELAKAKAIIALMNENDKGDGKQKREEIDC